MKEIQEKVLSIFKKYYVGLSLAMLSSIMYIYVIFQSDRGIDVGSVYMKIMFSITYGAFVSIIIRNVMERYKNKYLYLIVYASMLLAYLTLGNINYEYNNIRFTLLFIATSITVFVVPFIKDSLDSGFYTYKIIIGGLLTLLSYLVLLLGILLTIFSISTLFEFKIADYVFPSIMTFIMGFVMPTVFLLLFPEEKEGNYPGFINKLLMYAIYPILTVYTTVLYAYFLKILIEFELPSNMLGSLTIYYLFISVIVLYFSNKMKSINKWSNLFINKYPYLLILPSIMMLITFIVRINAYGFTEGRYYALLFFVFYTGSIYIILKNKVKYVIVLLSTLLLFSIYGPLSATNVSINSQINRLEAVLKENNMLVDNEILPSADLNDKQQDQIKDLLYYLERKSAFDKAEILPDNFDMSKFKDTFGFDLYYQYDPIKEGY
jgi:hypothetical protein